MVAVRALFESKGLYLKTDIPRDLPPVFCDDTRIRQVVIATIARIATSGKIGRPSLLKRFMERGLEIFELALESVKDPYAADAAELEIIKGAMEVERNGYTMYTNAVNTVASQRAKDIFQALAREEQHHYTLLKNTYDYMADPEGWHGVDESPMLDGG